MTDKNRPNTPYDDVFRTLLNDCSKLIIPVINEVFGEKYTGKEEIVFSPNEHFLNRQSGDEEKRITDSNFAVIGKSIKQYHFECESKVDYTVLIRIFEYDAQIALDQGSEVTDKKIIVSFPNTAILYLRSTSNTPDKMKIVIRTPGGEVSYDVPTIKVKSYSIEEIFEKDLLFLIPFYIFTYESQFKEINENADKVEKLAEEYANIKARLDQCAENGMIDEFSKKAIIDMSERVLENLAAHYENIRKGVGSVMGGHILDYEAKRIKNEGLEEGLVKGRVEGRLEGREEGIISTLISLVKDGILSIKDAAVRAGITEADFQEKMAAT